MAWRLERKLREREKEIVARLTRAGDAVYVYSATGRLTCRDDGSLRERWSISSERFVPIGALSGSLLSQRSGSRQIRGHDVRSGEIMWTRSALAVSVLHDSVLAATEAGIVEIDVLTGADIRCLFTGKVRSPGWRLGHDWIFTSEGGDPVWCFDVQNEVVRWSRNLVSELRAAELKLGEPPIIVVGDGSPRALVLTTPGDRPGHLIGLSRDEGELRWALRIDVPSGLHEALPDGKICTFDGNRLTVVDADVGGVIQEVTNAQLRGVGRPRRGCVFGKRVAYPCESGHLAIFDHAVGVLEWIYSGSAALWSCAHVDDRLLVGDEDGQILVLSGESKPGTLSRVDN
jgi:outer membrane protein assembly factor BamB